MSYKMPNGTIANYWKIVEIRNLDLVTKTATVIVRGYVSKEARDANVTAGVADRGFILTFEDTTGNLAAQAYEQLKTFVPPENPALRRIRRQVMPDGSPIGNDLLPPPPETFFKNALDA